MHDSNREMTQIPALTMGLDLGDRRSHYCVMDRLGRKVEEGEVRTRREAMEEFFAQQPKMRVVLETGTHSRWVQAVAQAQGHEVMVANPRRVRLISQNPRKGDRQDGELLARLGRVDPELLFPITPRSEATQAQRGVLRARDQLVRARTQLICHVRGAVKSFGERLPRCSSEAFARRVRAHIPARLELALGPLLQLIERITQSIRRYDRQIEQLCQQYPQIQRLRQIRGVGPVTALAFVLTLEDPRRWRRSRHVGAYLGLTPRQDQSGACDPQLRISKAGDRLTRRLLVTSAHYILGPWGPDCDLRRFGERLASRGGKNAKKRAVVAVARKLSVLLHHLWVHEEDYEPLYAHRQPVSQVA